MFGMTEVQGQPQEKEWCTINHHQNAETAALLCHHMSCIHQWPEDMDLSDEYTYNKIREKIRGQNVTPDIQADLASRFLKSQGRGSQEGGYLADYFATPQAGMTDWHGNGRSVLSDLADALGWEQD